MMMILPHRHELNCLQTMLPSRVVGASSRLRPFNLNIKCFLSTSAVAPAKRWSEKSRPEFTSNFDNPVREVAGMKAPPPTTGHIYDLKPMPVKVKAGCSYTWCGCGLARTQQPFCDLTCQNVYMSKVMKGGPVNYIAQESKEVWFCNCKQTSHKPFCDGSHRAEEVQKNRFDGPKQLWEPRAKKTIKS